MRLVSTLVNWLRSPGQASHASVRGADAPASDAAVPSRTSKFLTTSFIVIFGIAIPATAIYDLWNAPEIDLVNLPNVPSLLVHEHKLPQHNASYAESGRYVFFSSQHHWGAGFNNLWEEFIYLAFIAQRSNRSYVFRDLVFADHTEWPFTAFLKGPVAGGEWPADQAAPPAVSKRWFESVACPRGRRRIINADDVFAYFSLEGADAETIIARWAEILLEVPENCVEVTGRGFFDIGFWFGTPEISITAWPTFSKSPLITHHSWSDAVYSAVSHNLPRITNNVFTPSNERSPLTRLTDPPLTAHAELSNTISMHIRRGDYEGHCWILRHYSAPYAAFNVLPGLPDVYKPPAGGENAPDDAKNALMPHCLPDVNTVVGRLKDVVREYGEKNPDKPKLEEVFLMTNANDDFINSLRTELAKIGLPRMMTSKELELRDGEQFASMVIDMEIGIRSALFIGNGYSTFTSTIVALRAARGAPLYNSRFW